ncbi:hypothetical protein Golomagni_05908 [Golovinomyces magnicellulatus]|nr:hypothetical protein Golomagni_05908 [Golovinomyces magnicellulatus]
MLTHTPLVFFLISALLLATVRSAQNGLCLITRQDPDNCLSTSPVTFTVHDFTTFTPADGNPAPALVSFRYSNNMTLLVAHCSSRNDLVVDNDISALGENQQVSFVYNSNNLTIIEDYIKCPTTAAQVVGFLDINTFCYPNNPPSPYGYGTKCITPSGSISGSFS